MAGKILSREESAEYIRAVEQDLRLQREVSETEDSTGIPDIQVYEDESHSLLVTTRLARIPSSDWGSLRVSKTSLFRDIIWDFQGEGTFFQTCKTKFSWSQNLVEGVKLTDIECEPLLWMLKACVYCYLPQNNYIGYCSSYNSVVRMCWGFIKLARFFYAKRILIDTNGNGRFADATVITGDDFHDCILSEPTLSCKETVAMAWKFWQNLSDAGKLTAEYTISRNTVDLEICSKISKEQHENANTFMPISLEELSEVVPFCKDMIEKYSEEVLATYDFLHPLLCGDNNIRMQAGLTWSKALGVLKGQKSDLWRIEDFYVESGSISLVDRNSLLKVIRQCPDWPAYREENFPRPSKGLNHFSFNELAAIGKDFGIEIVSGTSQFHELKKSISTHPDWRKKRDNYLPALKDLGRASNDELIRTAQHFGINLETFNNGELFYNVMAMRSVFSSIFNTFIDACFIIICLVTGMRKSELMHLEAGRTWQDPGTGQYFLEFTVFKTDEASQGESVTIPIPEIAYKAYNVLERITAKARQHKGCNFLTVNTMSHFGKHMGKSCWYSRLKVFWERLGLEGNIHPHMFRKTIAMFAIYQDPRNLLIVKYLFSHKSLAMTLAYIIKIPVLAEEIKLAIVEHNADLLAEVLAAAVNGKIGGTCGVKIKEQFNAGGFAARLHHDGRQAIEDYVHSLIENGMCLLHRCPLKVICTNTHDSVVSINPEVCNCEVTNCDYAVFTETSLPDLAEEIRFHQQWIKHPLVSEDQVCFSNRKIKDCLARYAEIESDDAAMTRFPECYGLAA
ncbi:MAG: site-specific integrase [Desulfuromonadaceae bacterium]